MATSKDYATYIEDALRHVPKTRIKAMFGEYALYCGEVVVGSVCDDTVFIKITDGTRQLFDTETKTAPPYLGAKPAFVVSEGVLEDKELIKQIVIACSKDVAATAAKKKSPKPSRRK